jgi:WG containing repeat
MIIAPSFDSAASFSDGLGLVSKNGTFGYIDRIGAYAIEPSFKHAESFAEGLAVVGDVGSGYWYIDQSGHQAIPGKFALASPFYKGLAHTKILSSPSEHGNPNTRKFAYIDNTGKIVFEYEH